MAGLAYFLAYDSKKAYFAKKLEYDLITVSFKLNSMGL